MGARENPGFIRNARRIRTKGNVISTSFHDAHGLTFLLVQNVAENAPLLAEEIFTAGTQLIEHAARYEHSRRELRGRMIEFLPCVRAVVLEETQVLDPGIILKVEDALGREAQKQFDFAIRRLPQMALVVGIL